MPVGIALLAQQTLAHPGRRGRPTVRAAGPEGLRVVVSAFA
ncbi:hypothetical protein [Streptomyces sp. NPDC088350]